MRDCRRHYEADDGATPAGQPLIVWLAARLSEAADCRHGTIARRQRRLRCHVRMLRRHFVRRRYRYADAEDDAIATIAFAR